MKKKLLFLSAFCLVLSIGSVKSQVTIGSDEEPLAGALLQLKDDTPDPASIGITASRGLALPRVSLQSNSGDLGKSLDASVTTNGTLDKDAHIGLLVYNTNPIETSAAERLCPGLHIWDGNKWEPLSPYPDFNTMKSLAGPTNDLVDARDGEIYHTARFHTVVVTSGNPYTCDESNAPTTQTYDAGIWMTQNLRTKKTPKGSAIPLDGSAGNGYDLAIYGYPRPDGVANSATAPSTWTKEQGLLYNWAAATVGVDGEHGKGGADGEQNPINEDITNEGARIQGICPPNWHLPSDKEYYDLIAAMAADPTLYTTDGSGITASQSGYIGMSKDNLDGTDTGGRSKASNNGGFAVLLTGRASNLPAMHYGSTGYLWTSSSYNSGGAWLSGFIKGNPQAGRAYSNRFMLFSVRCKKD